MAHLQEINQRIFHCSALQFIEVLSFFSTKMSVCGFISNQCITLTAMGCVLCSRFICFSPSLVEDIYTQGKCLICRL